MLRAVSVALLAWLLWLSLDRSRGFQVTSARSADLARALREWTAAGVAPDGIHVQLDSSPSPRERDWLAAIEAAGSAVSWNGELPAIAMAVQPIVAPRGGLAVLAAAPMGTRVRLYDDVGVLDTGTATEGGARFAIRGASGRLTLRGGGARASAALPDSLRVRRVLVVGQAGWESKFVVAALEEDGWAVDAELRVAPGASVTQGAPGALDTARYAAVVALDASIASRAGQVARYVASGGGVVLASAAGNVAALAPIRAAAVGRIDAPPMGEEPRGPTTLRSLAVMPLIGLKEDAVMLERRGMLVVAAARRHVAGRVLQLGYVDSWRWRMSGGETSAQEHREWWTRAVSSVAFASVTARPTPASVEFRSPAAESELDRAPVASLIETLGPLALGPTISGAPVRTTLPRSWLFVLLSLCLLTEWGSRRLRGAP